MLLPHGTAIAVIDGENFKVFRNIGNEAEPQLSDALLPRLNSSNHSGTGHHSSPGNHADTQVSEDAHTIAAVEWLNDEVLGHRISSLIVIAPPRTLGEARKHYHGETRKAVLMEVSKDLSGRKPHEILAALRENV
jgi:protein required for attachment to host cells